MVGGSHRDPLSAGSSGGTPGARFPLAPPSGQDSGPQCARHPGRLLATRRDRPTTLVAATALPPCTCTPIRPSEGHAASRLRILGCRPAGPIGFEQMCRRDTADCRTGSICERPCRSAKMTPNRPIATILHHGETCASEEFELSKFGRHSTAFGPACCIQKRTVPSEPADARIGAAR